MKIIATADWHIRDRDITEIEKCLRFLVETAHKEQPDLIVHAGDVFHAAGVRADSLSAKLVFNIFKELANIAPVVIVIGTPSHDSDTASILEYIKAHYPVHVSAIPEQLYMADGRIFKNKPILPADAVISMVPAPTKQFFGHETDIKASDINIASELSKMFMGFAAQASEYDCPHLLVLHCTISGAAISETQVMVGRDIELSKDQIGLTSCDLAICGHIHFAQEITPSIFYPGSIYATNFGELEDKGFYIHEIKAKNLIESRFVKTPARKLVKLTEDLTGGGELADLTGIPLMDMLLPSGPTNIQNAIVKVEIKVFQDEAQKINVKELEESILANGAKNVNVQLIRIPRENVRSQNILKLTTLRDKLAEMAALKNETVLETILDKADLLESEEADKIIQGAI